MTGKTKQAGAGVNPVTVMEAAARAEMVPVTEPAKATEAADQERVFLSAIPITFCPKGPRRIASPPNGSCT